MSTVPKRVGIKSGCWTLLHVGHIQALQYAKERCDHLIVLTNTDDRVATKRGCVPVTMHDRIKILKELRCVDEVDWFSHATEDMWVRKFKDTRLYPEFGDDAQLILFHDQDLMLRAEPYPCQTIADDLVFIPYTPNERNKTSVKDMFKLIKQYGDIR